MTLRMKGTYYWGMSKAGVYDARAPVLPGCYQEQQRRVLNAKYGTISPEAFDREKETVYKDLKRRSMNTPVLLRIHLYHGDMVTMHGVEMQKYYEVNF